MRRAEYVAAAVRYYRAILDGNGNTAEKLSDLKRTYNRGNYTKGLAFGQDKRFLSTAIQGHLGEKVGVVKVVNKAYWVESNFTPQKGDGFKILRDGLEVGGAVFVKVQG
jgi:collagenase-like PrtC family protease